MKVRRDIGADDDSHPVMVPRNDKALMAVSLERVRRLREHLIKELRGLRMAKHSERFASPARPEPTGFAARVAHTACSLCKGWCCRNGDDDAFLDDRTLARVRLANPDMTERAILRLYLDRVPPVTYRDSCIFHGKQGCTLDRSLRADADLAGSGAIDPGRTRTVEFRARRCHRPPERRDWAQIGPSRLAAGLLQIHPTRMVHISTLSGFP